MKIKASHSRKIGGFVKGSTLVEIQEGRIYKVIRRCFAFETPNGFHPNGYNIEIKMQGKKQKHWVFIADDECEVVEGSINDISCPYCNVKMYSDSKVIHDYIDCFDYKNGFTA